MTMRSWFLCWLLLLCACGKPAPDTANKPWIREAPPGATMLSGYLRIDNPGSQPIRLLQVQSDDFGSIEVHRTEVVDGVSRMREVDDLSVPAGGAVVLEPGGMHLMLMQPRRALRAGDSVVIAFTWQIGADGRRNDLIRFDVRAR